MARFFVADIADVAFAVAVAFLASVLGATLGWGLLADCAVVVVAVGFVFRSFRLFASWVAIAFVFCTVIFGGLYFRWYLGAQAAKVQMPFGREISFSAIIDDEPKPSTKVLVLSADVEAPLAGPLTIFTPLGRDFQYGDKVRVTGTIDPSKTLGAEPTIFPKSIEVVATGRGFWLREWLIELKMTILQKFDEVLPEDEATLLGGILLGSKAAFRPELKNAMASSGTTHLVAISGYNITIIIVAIEQALGGLLSRRKTFVVTVAFIVLFVLMTGLQSSAIRAAIMGFLALAAKQSGRIFSMQNAIVFTAAIMVALDPRILVGDVGFQLSFLSLIGVVCLNEPVAKLFRRGAGDGASSDAGFLGWKDTALATLSAQLTVIPVIVAVFGNFSMTAIGANVLVLGTVPVTMLLGFLLALAGFASYYLAFFIAKIAWLILTYQLAVIRLFAALAVPLPVAFNSTLAFILYYGALGFFVEKFRGEEVVK